MTATASPPVPLTTAKSRGDEPFALALLGPPGAWALCMVASARGIPLPAEPSAPVLAIGLLIAPVVEELAFRGAVQGWLAGTWVGRHRWGLVSLPNALTSVFFALCHLPSHAPMLAAATCLPSLLLGRASERDRSLGPCILLHAWYNACFFGMLGQG